MSDSHDRFVVIPAAYVFLLRSAEETGAREVLLQLREGTGYMDGHWAAAVAGHVEREPHDPGRPQQRHPAAAKDAAEFHRDHRLN